mmetsp:Transcript_30388/g.49748  ORF Transcript_30388/g.49748 Transcript_30388/m.49748 type:complete len:81 (-) Transcript_30388:142-384(-)
MQKIRRRNQPSPLAAVYWVGVGAKEEWEIGYGYADEIGGVMFQSLLGVLEEESMICSSSRCLPREKIQQPQSKLSQSSRC